MTNKILKVCMLVWNDMRHDARVSKEAKTLSDAGYNVTVLCISTPGITKSYEKHDYGFSIKRISRYFFDEIDGKYFERRKNRNLTKGKRIHTAKNPIGLLRISFLMTCRLFSHVKILNKAFFMNADVYHAHDINVLPSLWLCAKLRRKPIVYDAHEISTSREGYQKVSKIVRKLENFLTKRVSAMITTTDMRANIFVNDYGCKRPIVLQNRPLWFEAAKTIKLRAEFNVSEDKCIVLYQGGIQAGRGLHNIVKAAANIENCCFVFIGSGRLKSELIQLVADLNISDRVKFKDTVPFEELPELTASADIGMQVLQNTCLNHYSTDSNKLFEYIMCGVPAVVSDFPEIRKVTEKVGSGILVDPDDIADITAGIKKLSSNAELRNLMAQNCKDHSKEFSWEEQEYKLIGLYADLTGNLHDKNC